MYASEKDRYLAHLIFAVDALSNGRNVASEAERALYAVERLQALGVNSVDMGAAIVQDLPYYANIGK